MATGSTEPLTSCSRCDTAFPLGARFCPNCGLPLEQSLRELARPRDPLLDHVVAGRYRILEVLGAGGMGTVYKVEHTQIGKLMAMKVLSGRLARNDMLRKRFQREARTASKLTHPNTVQIFDFGESDQLAYLVMEYLPGRDLGSVIADGPLGFSRVAAIAAQVAASVGEAHSHGIVHRDIKPENVMILDAGEQREFVKVLDFGIAKAIGIEERLTGLNELIGTPYYMAPEQIRGEPVDHRTDIYALGGLMYKALTGEPPYPGDNPQMLVTAHLHEKLIPLRRRAPYLGIPEEAERVVGKALQKDPARRFASMEALRDELLRYLRSQGVPSGAFQVEEDEEPLRPSAEFATRDDLDRYERSTLRAGFRGKLALGVAVVALAAGGWAARARWLAANEPLGEEREPNDDPGAANLIAPGGLVTGHVGALSSAGAGDADVFRIELAGATARVASITLDPPPGLNLALDVVPRGSSTPLLSVNSAGPGEPEQVPNLGLPDDTYFLRVREVVAPGQDASANVAAPYTLLLTLAAELKGFERELNDVIELASSLPPGETQRGYVGWSKDRDVWCAAPGQGAQTVELSGVPELDLLLSYLDRTSDSGQRVDRNGIGEGERLELPAASSARTSCFTVRAKEREHAEPSNPWQPYELRLSAGSE